MLYIKERGFFYLIKLCISAINIFLNLSKGAKYSEKEVNNFYDKCILLFILCMIAGVIKYKSIKAELTFKQPLY